LASAERLKIKRILSVSDIAAIGLNLSILLNVILAITSLSLLAYWAGEVRRRREAEGAIKRLQSDAFEYPVISESDRDYYRQYQAICAVRGANPGFINEQVWEALNLTKPTFYRITKKAEAQNWPNETDLRGGLPEFHQIETL